MKGCSFCYYWHSHYNMSYCVVCSTKPSPGGKDCPYFKRR